MFQLTKEQKLENYQELLDSKRRKVENLKKEILQIEKKVAKLQASSVSNSENKIKTSTDLDLIPGAVRSYYTYDPAAPSYQPGQISSF